MRWGVVIGVGSTVAYLTTNWDVLAMTGIGLGVALAAAHYAITRSFRGPTVPR